MGIPIHILFFLFKYSTIFIVLLLRREFSIFKSKYCFLTDSIVIEAVDPSKIIQCAYDRELADERNLLRHVTYSWSWNTRAFGSWFSTQDPNFSTVQFSCTDDAAQKRRFSASTSTQQPISENYTKKSIKTKDLKAANLM